MLQHPYPVALFVFDFRKLEKQFLLRWDFPYSAAKCAGWLNSVQEHAAVLATITAMAEHTAGL
jgi:hypothetical protein